MFLGEYGFHLLMIKLTQELWNFSWTCSQEPPGVGKLKFLWSSAICKDQKLLFSSSYCTDLGISISPWGFQVPFHYISNFYQSPLWYLIRRILSLMKFGSAIPVIESSLDQLLVWGCSISWTTMYEVQYQLDFIHLITFPTSSVNLSLN